MTNDRSHARFRTNLYQLQVTLGLARDGIPVTIGCGGEDFIFNTPDAGPIPDEMMIPALAATEELKSLTNVEFLDYVPVDRFIEKMHEASVAIPLDAGSSNPLFALHGIVPALFADYGLNFYTPDTLRKL